MRADARVAPSPAVPPPSAEDRAAAARVGHARLRDEMEYFRIFDRHEGLRWSLNRDVPWDAFRAEAVDEPLRFAIHTACVSEFTTLAASHNFLREFADDVDFSCWVSVWFYEEIKHHYALRRWLALAGIHVPSAEIAKRGIPYPLGTNHAGTCTMNVISELRAARWYTDISRTTTEPVLAALMRHMAADESRHAVAFADFARRYVERNGAEDLRAVLEMAYFWLADPAVVTHPADFFYPDAATDHRIDLVPMTQDGLAQANAKIFGYVSAVTGLDLASCRDIKRALRPLFAARRRAS
jgi:hypothetical protein